MTKSNQIRNPQAFKLAVQHYLAQIKQEWRLSIPIFLLPGIGSTLVFYVPALVIASLLQKFSNHQILTPHELLPYVLIFAGIWIVGEVLWRISIQLMIIMELRVIKRLYINAMQAMLDKDLSFFHDNFAGSLTKKTIGYAKNFESFVDTIVFSVVSNFVPLIFISYVLWQFSPWLVLGLVGMLALTISLVVPLILRRQKLVSAREAASNVVSGYIADIYANVDAVRGFANERHEQIVYQQHVSDLMQKSERSWSYQNLKVDVLTSPLYVLTNVTGLIIALAIGGNDPHTIGKIFVTFSYYASFTRIMWEFNHIYRQIETALSEAAQFTELLFEEPTVKDPSSPKRFTPQNGAIELRNISFRYEEKDREMLFKNFNLSIKPGEKIGLVGYSGGGKTTIIKLLMRFIDIDDGQILIDGQDIALLAQSDLRDSIAYVPQDPVMFHRSLAENIQYGRLDASQQDIQLAAKRAYALEFINQMPQGFATLVGERGVKLSGGQRQRIAIARAILRDAPILLLDEATSSLDSDSEKFIQAALRSLMEDKTAIVIAHRLSTIQKMDRIIVLEDGEIVEQGSHKELLQKKDGTYARLWAHQSGGFMEDDEE